MNRMIKGKIQFGTPAQTLYRWEQEGLKDCSPEDQIWGWSIRSSEMLHYDRAKIDDEVLVDMCYIGLLDKKTGAPAWSEPSSLKQGIRLVTNMVVRAVQKILKVEEKVQRPGRFSLIKANQVISRSRASRLTSPGLLTLRPISSPRSMENMRI